jgi:plasmid stability protein
MYSLIITSRKERQYMNLIVRNLPDDVHRALKVRAAQIGSTLQDLIKDILTKAAALDPEKAPKTKKQKK